MIKRIGKILLACGVAFLLSLPGVVLQTHRPMPALFFSLLVTALLPPLLFLLGILLAKGRTKVLRDAPVAEMRSYFLHCREEAERTSQALLGKLRRIRRVTVAYAVLLLFLAVGSALFFGMLATYGTVFGLIGVAYVGTLLLAVSCAIPRRRPCVLSEEAWVLSREEYPELYETAAKAAEAVGCRGEITLLLAPDHNASILSKGDRYYLQLGATFLFMLSREELYAICLHEFSHVAPKNRDTQLAADYDIWLSSDRGLPPPFQFVTGFYARLDLAYAFHHMICRYATSVVRETDADRDMVEHGDPAAIASALLKLDYYEKYTYEDGVTDTDPVYKNEEPPAHYLRDHIANFLSAIERRRAAWDALVEKEILANNATHPTLRMRLATLGLRRAEYIERGQDGVYAMELERMLEYADKRLLEAQTTYEKDRKEGYLEPLSRITAWEEDGMPIRAETYADLVSDLRQLGRNEAAEALCDRVIAELSESSAVHARYMKGCALLHRYDDAGLELLYGAIESNSNYLEEGMDTIGSFLCRMGREEELQAYRERACRLAQKQKDEYSELDTLSPGDDLGPEQLPEGVLEDILAYIRSVDSDIIERIYLVRKTISAEFFASVFVIHFYGGTEAMREEILHKIFRYLDSYPVEWQFSLFDYFACRQVRFDKIEGSLVYEKTK